MAIAPGALGGASHLDANTQNHRGQLLVPHVSDLPRIDQISSSGDHTCVVQSSESAYCWGLNTNGDLGDNTTITRDHAVEVRRNAATFLSNVLEVAAGGDETPGGHPTSDFTCAIIKSAGGSIASPKGTVDCWGFNAFSQLGFIGGGAHPLPVAVPLLAGVRQLAAGENHTCALLGSGLVECSGDNSFGQLGTPGATHVFGPAVNSLRGVTQIAAGGNHTCAIEGGTFAAPLGTVYCWGDNAYGQLGQPFNNVPNPVPAQVPGIARAVQVTTGGNQTCALLQSGVVDCWGLNLYGQLGNAGGSTSVPTPVTTALRFKQVSAGYSHTCAFTSGGSAYCWGYNGFGQLGDGATTALPNPVPRGPIALKALELGTGQNHTCLVTTSHLVYCWGLDIAGELGLNSFAVHDAPSGPVKL
jgi:alpha-tubulin suppressor-like RCC1 family protein